MVCYLIVQEKLNLNFVGHHSSAGVEAETKVLHGTTSLEIIREVIRGNQRFGNSVFCLRERKGRSGEFFGSTGTRLLRHAPARFWLASPERTEFQKCAWMRCTFTDEPGQAWN